MPNDRGRLRASHSSIWSAAVVVAAVAVVVAPWFQPGWFAVYDLLLLPEMPLTDAALGVDAAQPRNVPSDALAALLATLPLTQVTYRVLLVGILLAAGLGARWCLRDHWWPAAAAAGMAYIWNPYVFERLAIGQWALLMGFAAIPWVVAGVSRSAMAGAVALVIGCLGGVSASLLLLAALLTALVATRQRWRVAGTWVGLWVLGSAPWLLVGIARMDAFSDPSGFAAFAPRADTPLGTVGSLLTLGGFWSSRSDPPGRDQVLVAVLSLAFVLVAILAAIRHVRITDVALSEPSERQPVHAALWVGVVGLALALGSAWPVARDVLSNFEVIGSGVFRDGQKWIALWVLPVALGAGCFVSVVAVRCRLLGATVAAFAIAAPVALTPALALGLAGRVVPVEPPLADWSAAVAEIRSDPGPVLSLPWAPYRTTIWSQTTVLDPTTKIAPVPVVWNDSVRVGGLEVRGESDVAQQVTVALADGRSPVDAAREVGARWIWLDASGFEAVEEENLAGAELSVSAETLRLYRVDADQPYPGPVAGRWVAWLGIVVWFAGLVGTRRIGPLGSTPRTAARSRFR